MAHHSACKDCGWTCRSCDNEGVLHLHAEVENLKQQLLERESHIRIMETSFLAEAEKFPNGEAAALTEELLTWQDKYTRLYDSYKRVQKVNQSLEDKLLKIVDKCETEKNDLLKEVSALTQRLSDARKKFNRLQSENERYKNDVSIAIQLLQCKPANFVPQKYDLLPADLQQKVLAYVCGRRRQSDVAAVPIRVEMRTIKVPVSTSPPSSMLYPVNEAHSSKEQNMSESNEDIELINETEINYVEGHPPLDNISAAIMAKVLEERQRERQQGRHCETCSCFTHVAPVTIDSATQTSTADLETNIPGLNGYTATTRGSQGHVRFVDSVSRNFSGNSNAKTNFPNQLGLKLPDSRNVKSDTNLINFDSSSDPTFNSSLENCLIDLKEDILAEVSNSSRGISKTKPLDNNLSFNQRFDQFEIDLDKNVSTGYELNGKFVERNSCRSSSPIDLIDTSEKNEKDTCIIDLEVSPSIEKCDILKANRSKELQVARNTGKVFHKNHSAVTSLCTMGSQSIHSKSVHCDGKNVSTPDSTAATKSPSNWVRFSNDTNKKSTLVVSSEKTVAPSVRPSDSGPNRVQFPALSLRAGNKNDSSPGTGPRFCSMRVQAGTSNILLDNATSYEPVLYTSRHTQDGVESWGVSASRSGAAVLVHAPRSRAPSLDETPSQNKVALWVHANPSQSGT